MAEDERGAKGTLWPFYKEFGRGSKCGPNGIETGVHNFFEHSSRNQGLLQLVYRPWQWQICFKLLKIGRKGPKTGETQSLPFGHFIKSLGEAVNLGQMALKQACTNVFGEYSTRNEGLVQLV